MACLACSDEHPCDYCVIAGNDKPMTDTDKPDAGEKRLKKVLSDHHKAQMRGKMGGAAMCVCGQGCGTTAACGEYHELLNQSAQLSALRTKLAEVEAERDRLRESARILQQQESEAKDEADTLRSDLANLRSLLAGATEIHLGGGDVVIPQADGKFFAEAKSGGQWRTGTFETIEQASAFVRGKDGELHQAGN